MDDAPCRIGNVEQRDSWFRFLKIVVVPWSRGGTWVSVISIALVPWRMEVPFALGTVMNWSRHGSSPKPALSGRGRRRRRRRRRGFSRGVAPRCGSPPFQGEEERPRLRFGLVKMIPWGVVDHGRESPSRQPRRCANLAMAPWRRGRQSRASNMVSWLSISPRPHGALVPHRAEDPVVDSIRIPTWQWKLAPSNQVPHAATCSRNHVGRVILPSLIRGDQA